MTLKIGLAEEVVVVEDKLVTPLKRQATHTTTKTLHVVDQTVVVVVVVVAAVVAVVVVVSVVDVVVVCG